MASHVPGLDDPALGGVDVLLLLDVLDADAEAVLGEDDVLLGHAGLGVVADLGRAEVDLVPDEGDAAEDGQEDEEGQELAGVLG